MDKLGKKVEVYNAGTLTVELSKHDGWSFGYYEEDRKVSVSVSDLQESGDWLCLDALEELVRKMKEFDYETK